MRDWRIILDSKLSELCTFNTPFGRYKFNRLPFGIFVAHMLLNLGMKKPWGHSSSNTNT